MVLWYAAKSKDPNTQCGAMIVSKDNEPLGWGYNGPPKQIDDFMMHWGREPYEGLTKYDLVDHSEENAIKYSCGNLYQSTMYVSAKPCKDCMKDIVRAGISRVVYFDAEPDKGSMLEDEEMMKTEQIAELGNVELICVSKKLTWMAEWYDRLKQMGAV
jgi:dCMP deaminase